MVCGAMKGGSPVGIDQIYVVRKTFLVLRKAGKLLQHPPKTVKGYLVVFPKAGEELCGGGLQVSH